MIEKKNGIVCLDYDSLVKRENLTVAIAEAYGPDGLGILVVKNVPNFQEKRKTLLQLARVVAQLPAEKKAKVEDATTTYNFGWSHGKETLDGKTFDVFKGSYYNNPQYDEPTTDEGLIKKYPAIYGRNIWPREDVPELETAFKDLGQLIVSVGELIGFQCDEYVRQHFATTKCTSLEEVIKESRTCKARLLYYFPPDSVDKSSIPEGTEWCAWHCDHGSLTGLCPALYLEAETGNEASNPDPDCGLYIRNRKGEEVRGVIPKDCLAFQIGQLSQCTMQSAQVMSAGKLVATPHGVKPPKKGNGVARCTFAVFMQPDLFVPMAVPQTEDNNAAATGVPQYKPGQTFADFMNATLKQYYKD